MSQLVEQTRERVVKAVTNHSTAKQLWTFTKKKRFHKIKTQCPHVAYQSQLNTFNSRGSRFSSTKRRIFQDLEGYPSPADYTPKEDGNKGITFGQSRSKCCFSTYLQKQQLMKPGPTDYEKYGEQDNKRSKRGFTIRPKTAHQYNYFIEDKEKEQNPGPQKYETTNQNVSWSKITKFKSTQTGAALMKSQRFLRTCESPGPTSYDPKKVSLRHNFHCIMPKTLRFSSLGRTISKELSPGPGDYNLPSQFGHYTKPKSRSKAKRLLTID